MEIYPCQPNGLCEDSIAKAVEALRSGLVVAHPTDTCYGLAVDIHNESAVKRLYDVKAMPLEKPVSILVRSLDEAKEYGEFSDMAIRMAQDFWPGPLTLVLPKTDKIPAWLNPGSSSIGIRVIDEPVSMALLKAFGGPLTTTSANKHQDPSAYFVEEIVETVDAVLDAGHLPQKNQPSTVMKIEGNQVVTLRRGNLAEMYQKQSLGD
jgi:L-threonylcarbamoyladenylate synthase